MIIAVVTIETILKVNVFPDNVDIWIHLEPNGCTHLIHSFNMINNDTCTMEHQTGLILETKNNFSSNRSKLILSRMSCCNIVSDFLEKNLIIWNLIIIYYKDANTDANVLMSRLQIVIISHTNIRKNWGESNCYVNCSMHASFIAFDNVFKSMRLRDHWIMS